MTTTLSVELASLAAELRGIAEQNWCGFDAWQGSEAGILASDRVRQIGELANRVGGFDAMQQIAYCAFAPANGPMDQAYACALSELNVRWDRIGDWLA